MIYLPIISILIGAIYLILGSINILRDDQDLERALNNTQLGGYILLFISVILAIIMICNPPKMF